MALGLFAQIGIIAHLYSLLVPSLDAKQAGLAMGLVTATAVLGRTCIGWFMPVDADRPGHTFPDIAWSVIGDTETPADHVRCMRCRVAPTPPGAS